MRGLSWRLGGVRWRLLASEVVPQRELGWGVGEGAVCVG